MAIVGKTMWINSKNEHGRGTTLYRSHGRDKEDVTLLLIEAGLRHATVGCDRTARESEPLPKHRADRGLIGRRREPGRSL